MACTNRVLWSEGLFLRPHHFQQQDRYLEHLIAASRRLGMPHPWGLRRLRLDQDLLALGKLSLTEVIGLLPDDTPIDAPASDPLPAPIQVGEDSAGQILYLALPLQRPGARESGGPEDAQTMLRYRAGEETVRDNTTAAQTEELLEVGQLDLRLLLGRDNRDGYACCGIARILERRSDGQVLLDQNYIPPCVEITASTRLRAFLEELQGLCRRRADTLAARVRAGASGGVSEWANFLLLQLINRQEPLVAHLAGMDGHHPETLYRELLQFAGELSTFTTDDKRPPVFPVYDHEDLAATFGPVFEALRQFLSREGVERAIAIPIQERKFGFRVALVADKSLLDNARFVLAAKAGVDPEKVRGRFPAQAKIGPIDKIQELVKLALPGIGLYPMPMAPMELPYHAGFNYFELDRTSDFWRQLAPSGGFGLHVGGEFPDLELELWAIRE
ncbi:type VI secretion system baseplate subunit TssK [Thiohalocapsa marina]|uniref:Type VI secretion system baseplate subunit TssK n=1 Tax=Thiohalocapsa marina TaxID=424902 RepID=A0A5M8FU77_9GAMM|nr:type VI secretion system baseplate subunit TssK [Thiohalocapsa marina]KAA6187357.1 type VI secretion system baseplate subunit TssK [Thiohalocapsa marina]